MMLQGVREVFELADARDGVGSGGAGAGGSEEGVGVNGGKESVEGKIVVIGRGLERRVWQESLRGFLEMVE